MYQFGCCDRTSIISVDTQSGKFNVSSIKRNNAISGAGAEKCQAYGCGFVEIGGFNAKTNKIMSWVENLLPQPPPAPAPQNALPSPTRGGAHQRSRSTRAETIGRAKQIAATRALGRVGSNPDPTTFIGLSIVDFDMATSDAVQARPFHMDGSNEVKR